MSWMAQTIEGLGDRLLCLRSSVRTAGKKWWLFCKEHWRIIASCVAWWALCGIGLVLFAHSVESALSIIGRWGLDLIGVEHAVGRPLRVLVRFGGAIAWVLICIRFLWRYHPDWGAQQDTQTLTGPFWKIPYAGDAPIQEYEEDKLRRTNLVRTLKGRLLGTMDAENAAYIGLYGGWGEGKTSVYNLLRKECADSPLLFVDFAPWCVLKRENLPVELFGAIANAVEKRLPKTQARQTFRALGLMIASRKLSSYVSLIPACGSILEPLFKIGGSDRGLKAMAKRDLRVLSGMFRIVVVLDDMDRLPPKDVCELIRLIRTNGDLPNITYLLIGDQKHIASALQQMLTGEDRGKDGNPDGLAYLEKIFPIIQPLSPAPPITYQNWFLAELEKLLARHLNYQGLKMPTEFECESVFPFLKTARCVRRLLTAVEGALGHFELADGGEPRVHLADIIAVKALELFENDFYTRLYKQRDVILGFDSNLHILNPVERTMDPDQMAKQFYPQATGDGVVAIKAFFLRHLMLAEVAKKEGVHTTSGKVEFTGDELQLQAEFRVASAAYFDKYFIGVSDESASQASIRDVEAFRKSWGEETSAENYLLELAKSGKVKTLLRLMEAQNPIPSVVRERNYLLSILRLGDHHVIGGQNASERVLGLVGFLDVYEIIARCIIFYLQKTPYDTSARSSMLTELIKESGSIAVAVELIGREDGKDGTHRYECALFTEVDFLRMRELVLDRIEGLQSEGRLIDYPRERSIRHAWRIFAMHSDTANLPTDPGEILAKGNVTPREDRFAELTRGDFARYPHVLHAIQPFREYSSRDPVWFSPLWCGELERLMGAEIYNVIETTLKANESDLCRDGMKLLEAVRYIQEIKQSKGLPPSTDEQRDAIIRDEDMTGGNHGL